jgi:TatA/E family protein of Tat protein translocase
MFGIGPMELVLILVVALLVFGPKRMPELARNLGRGLAEFRRASNDLRQTLALDDLQRDIKRDLANAQKIDRPTDRPAQAGDDLPVGGAASATPTPHPGELPLGNDHEHHDSMDENDAPTSSSTGAPEGDPSAAASPTPSMPPKAAPTTKAATPADPGLGNVPVSEPSNPPEPKRG